ncbi:MAG: hypothetical protein SCALA702_22610 [Melioribacteraceae bacterium]|nr:MAG: hypothetical protein SCALA702_22610 [Melioribacteraceae bacterium]
MKKRLLLLLVLPALLFFTACDDEEYIRDTVPPNPPVNVKTFNRDSRVDITWSPNAERDLAGYNVYYSTDYHGRYEMIGSTSSTFFIDDVAVNGDKYYYAITAYDYDGNESELSYDEVYGIARPEGYNRIVYDYIDFPDLAGYSFAENKVYPFNDLATDFFFENYEGTYYLNVWEEADIQDMGATDDILDITVAPVDGYIPLVDGENVKYTIAQIGHTYIVWTVDNHYAKLRIASITPERMVFDWAYQIAEGERSLKREEEVIKARTKVIKGIYLGN